MVRLAGEYVLQILVSIANGLTQADAAGTNHRALYGRFLAANPDFFALTERRTTSYWACYYRWKYPDFQRYPGSDLLTQFHAMAIEQSNRRLPRNSPARRARESSGASGPARQ